MWIWAVWVVGAAFGAVLVGGQEPLESPALSLEALLYTNDYPPMPTRRITPKSVFVAPMFCPEGSRMDRNGQCVKPINITKEALLKYYLSKLNSMYVPAPEPSVPKEPTGPLRLPIPLGEAETTSALPLLTTTEEPEPSTVTTSVPSTTYKYDSAPMLVTNRGERVTESPLIIIIPNTTETHSTTEKEWTTNPTTITPPTESTVHTTDLQPGTGTVLPTATTDCEDCRTTTLPSSGDGWFFELPTGGSSNVESYAETSTPDYRTTTRSVPTYRPPTYLPPQYRPVLHPGIRQTTTTTTARPKVEAVLRPQFTFNIPTTPSPLSWIDIPYGSPQDYDRYGAYTTKRSTIRFPSDSSSVPVNSFRFPPQQIQQNSHLVYWQLPPNWKLSPRPVQRPTNNPNPINHREPRPSWTSY